MLGPIATMAGYEPLRRPTVSELRRRARRAIDGLQSIAAYEPTCGEWGAIAMVQNEAAESWMITLHQLRSVQLELESGPAARRLVREVSLHAKDLAPALSAAVENALRTARELRAFVAVVTGEHDDEELGIEVLPSPRESRAALRGPSVTFEW